MVTTVNELISPVDGFWDVNLVSALFWPVDAERILHIPLHMVGRIQFPGTLIGVVSFLFDLLIMCNGNINMAVDQVLIKREAQTT